MQEPAAVPLTAASGAQEMQRGLKWIEILPFFHARWSPMQNTACA